MYSNNKNPSIYLQAFMIMLFNWHTYWLCSSSPLLEAVSKVISVIGGFRGFHVYLMDYMSSLELRLRQMICWSSCCAGVMLSHWHIKMICCCHYMSPHSLIRGLSTVWGLPDEIHLPQTAFHKYHCLSPSSTDPQKSIKSHHIADSWTVSTAGIHLDIHLCRHLYWE